MSDPVVSAAVEAGRVPDEVSIAFLSESHDTPAIAGIIAVTALTAVAVVGRSISRVVLVRRFGFDDGLAVLGLIHLIVFASLCIKLIDIGSGRHYEYIMYAMPADVVDYSEVLDFGAHLLYTTALLVCRLSGLAFYHRLCGDHKKFAVAIKATAGIIFVGYVPQMCLIIFHCAPVTGLWPYDWQPQFGDYVCLPWGVVYVTNSGVSLLCDIFLFGIPLAMIWMLSIPRKRKVQLAGILMPGTFVVAISITRLVLVVKGQWEPDMSWTYNPMLAVEVSEIGATLIALSVPGLKPLFDKFILGKDIPTQGKSGSKTADSRPGLASSSTALRSLNSRHGQQNPTLYSRDTLKKHMQSRYDVESGYPARDRDETSSTEGIMVRVDFNVKEEQDRLSNRS